MKALYIIYLVVAVVYSLYCYKMFRDEDPQSERKNLILSLVCALIWPIALVFGIVGIVVIRLFKRK